MTQEQPKIEYYYHVELPNKKRFYTYKSDQVYHCNDVVLVPVSTTDLPIKGRIIDYAGISYPNTKKIISLYPIDDCPYTIKYSYTECKLTGVICSHPNPICVHWGTK